MGLREKNKAEKLERIRKATLEVLAEKGFEATTIKEISTRAGVGHGTIFSYAQNKVDLCLLSVSEGLDTVTSKTFESLDAKLPILDQLITFFRTRYLFWARRRELFFAATQQLTGRYLGGSLEIDRARDRRTLTITCIVRILARGQLNGEIKDPLELDKFSKIIFDVYQQELRFWLSDDSNEVDVGLTALSSLLASLIGVISTKNARSKS